MRTGARHLLRWGSALAPIAILAALLCAAPAWAGCGGPEVAQPTRHVRGQRPPLVIGDSTMLLALYQLAGKGYDAEAQGCREFPAALALIAARKRQGTLPHMVVLALGANGSVTHDDVGEALGLLCCTRFLVLVTPVELGGGSGSDAVVEREEARRHRGRILLLDWVKYSHGHPDWFQPDGLHLTTPGAAAFTRLLAKALPYAQRKRGRPHKRHGHVADTVPSDDSPPSSPAPAPPTSPAPAPLTLHAGAVHTGYVSVRVGGPAFERVRVGEQVGSSTRQIEVLTLGSDTIAMPRLLRWRCDRLTRHLVATSLPPAAVQNATATVRTPNCARRLATSIRGAPVGGSLTIRLRDRWSIGGLPLRICVAAPGTRPTCRPWNLHLGQRRREITQATGRPGGWQVSVGTRYQRPTRRVVWASHPGGRIRLLAAGDSEMQLLDDFLGQDLRSYGVAVSSDARISTGLTNSFFFDWQSHAREQAASLRPDVTVMFMGANDGFAVPGPQGRMILCCGAGWGTGYATLVARMMTTYLRGNAGRVYWFLLPTPSAGNFQSLFNGVNRGIRLAARRFPGRVALVDANAFFTPGNRYRDFMSYHGQGFVIHEADGVHLSVASDSVAATLVVHQLIADHIVR